MHKKTVLDMLESLGEGSDPKQLCAGSLCDKMGAYSDSGQGATEFTMYTLWAYQNQKSKLECAHAVELVPHFEVKYSSEWRDDMDRQLRDINVTTSEAREQMSVSSHDGWPIDWSPVETDGSKAPTKDKFPLKVEDLSRSWQASLWRGEPSNADLLEAVNMWTLQNLVEGKRQYPLMFGAQPEALSTMDEATRKQAIKDLAQVYAKAKLHVPSTDSDKDLVDCVVGWKN